MWDVWRNEKVGVLRQAGQSRLATRERSTSNDDIMVVKGEEDGLGRVGQPQEVESVTPPLAQAALVQGPSNRTPQSG